MFDKLYKREKRSYLYRIQSEILNEANHNQNEFWKTIGKVGIGVKKNIPMEVVLDDGSISSNKHVVLNKWKNSFSELFDSNGDISDLDFNITDSIDDSGEPLFDDMITLFEVQKAVNMAKNNKASGIDAIPVEVLKNDTAISCLHILFNICFRTGKIPSDWGRGIINPIPKSNTTDPRDPSTYRGITLASCMYKLYCFILNTRLSGWVEENDKLVDEQNGFRKDRNTIDQVISLTNLIETRQKQRLSTFCAFIDFKKAFDLIDRNLLWRRLSQIGIHGKMFDALKSLYTSVHSCVRVNGFKSEWFNVKAGLRQGCSLSPILFNIFINDFALSVKAFGKGVDIGDGEKVSIMLYADDMVLIADNENDLQLMLDILNRWCIDNRMSVNPTKSQIVHFRPRSVPRTDYKFTCGVQDLQVVDRYVYLGLTLTEFLDFGITAKMVSQSASRALGLLIAKFKIMGGMPFDVYSKLYDTMVWPVISYGAAVWGDQTYSCIEAVQNRAMRFFLGVGRYTPTAAVSGDMGWTTPVIRQWKSICNFWARYSMLSSHRINKRIFLYANQKCNNRCKNWPFRIRKHLNNINCSTFNNVEHVINKRKMVEQVRNSMKCVFLNKWFQSVSRDQGVSGRGGNKLRKYRLFKVQFETEQYCKTIMPRAHRSAFAKFRTGVAPLRIETGRYEGLSEAERKCYFCKEHTEDELHVLFDCPLYNDIRSEMFQYARMVNEDFEVLTKSDRFKFLFSSPNMIRSCAKACFLILHRRAAFLTK